MFYHMQKHGPAPNVVAYGTAIAACAIDSDWEKVLELLDDMKSNNIKANVVALSAAIEVLSAAHKLDEATIVFRDGISLGVFCDIYKSSWRIDLHSCSAAVSRIAISSYLADLKEGCIPMDSLAGNDLVVITGKGLHSANVPVLPKFVNLI